MRCFLADVVSYSIILRFSLFVSALTLSRVLPVAHLFYVLATKGDQVTIDADALSMSIFLVTRDLWYY
jgi:hypothetical protein